MKVNGTQTHELYKHLRVKSELYTKIGCDVKDVPWSFSKFLVNKKGDVVRHADGLTDVKSLEKEIKLILNV